MREKTGADRRTNLQTIVDHIQKVGTYTIGYQGQELENPARYGRNKKEYCSELYKESAKEDKVSSELEAISPSSISPSSTNDQRDLILLEYVESAIKRLT